MIAASNQHVQRFLSMAPGVEKAIVDDGIAKRPTGSLRMCCRSCGKLQGLANALNERDLRTMRGGAWHASSVRNLIHSTYNLAQMQAVALPLSAMPRGPL
jgi:hypothetical protein